MSTHRINDKAVESAREAVVELGVDAPDALWVVASGRASRRDLVAAVGELPEDILHAAAPSLRAVDVAETLNEAAEAEHMLVIGLSMMIDYAWERALQQAAARAKIKLEKSRRRDEFDFKGWPDPSVATYVGVDGLLHGQFELAAKSIASEVGRFHDRMVEHAEAITAAVGASVDMPQDRSGELEQAIIAALRAKAVAYITGQLKTFDPTVMARNIVAYATFRMQGAPDLFGDATTHGSVSSNMTWLEHLATLFTPLSPGFEWRHAFYRIPVEPFEPHVALDGSTFTPGEIAGLAFWPGDHPHCTCALVKRWTWR